VLLVFRPRAKNQQHRKKKYPAAAGQTPSIAAIA
jgi:hypothetical protein